MDALERFDEADRQWTAAEETAAERKAALFQAAADAVRDGHTPDSLAARLKDRKTPPQLEAGITFSAVYLRRMVRELGVPKLQHGPKPKKAKPAGE